MKEKTSPLPQGYKREKTRKPKKKKKKNVRKKQNENIQKPREELWKRAGKELEKQGESIILMRNGAEEKIFKKAEDARSQQGNELWLCRRSESYVLNVTPGKGGQVSTGEH